MWYEKDIDLSYCNFHIIIINLYIYFSLYCIIVLHTNSRSQTTPSSSLQLLHYLLFLISKAALVNVLILFLAFLNLTEVCHKTSLSTRKIMTILKYNYHQQIIFILFECSIYARTHTLRYGLSVILKLFNSSFLIRL